MALFYPHSEELPKVSLPSGAFPPWSGANAQRSPHGVCSHASPVSPRCLGVHGLNGLVSKWKLAAFCDELIQLNFQDTNINSVVFFWEKMHHLGKHHFEKKHVRNTAAEIQCQCRSSLLSLVPPPSVSFGKQSWHVAIGNRDVEISTGLTGIDPSPWCKLTQAPLNGWIWMVRRPVSTSHQDGVEWPEFTWHELQCWHVGAFRFVRNTVPNNVSWPAGLYFIEIIPKKIGF